MSASLRAVSLYAGAGGLDYGFHLAGVETLWANELDEDAARTFARLLPGVGMAIGDITKIRIPPLHGVDLVIGGPPCQGFSVAGRMDPHDPRSQHIWRFLDVVTHLKPRGFVMENVKALAANGRWGHILRRFQKNAESAGYRTHVHVLNAAEYGVPQARERMFLVGMIEGSPELTFKTRTTPTVRQCLEQLPSYGRPGNNHRCTAVVTPAKVPVLRKSPYAGMLFNGQGRPIDLDGAAPTLPASMGGNRTPIIDQLHLEGAEPWVPVYHARLMDGEPPLETIPSRLRRLTVEEAAALQTFPAGMKWVGRQSSVFRQIGNAVPPLLAYAVACAVTERLGEISGDASATG